MTVKLAHGPRLTYKSHGMKKKVDVTARGHEFLFEEVELAEDVTLADIFGLLEASPLLGKVFRRDYARELLAEVQKGAVKDKAKKVDRIEYLEVYSHWEQDTSNNAISGNNRLQFHGLGFVLKKPIPNYAAKAGERVKFSVSLAPIRELLSLPVRINPNTPVYEADMDAFLCYKELHVVNQEGFTLGQVIHSILWELSFHGAPAQSAKFTKSLKKQVDSIKKGTLKSNPVGDMFDGFDRPGVNLMFESISDHSPSDISRVLRSIPDTGDVPGALHEEFGDSVVVKDEYKALAGYEFRKTFRLVKRTGGKK